MSPDTNIFTYPAHQPISHLPVCDKEHCINVQEPGKSLCPHTVDFTCFWRIEYSLFLRSPHDFVLTCCNARRTSTTSILLLHNSTCVANANYHCLLFHSLKGWMRNFIQYKLSIIMVIHTCTPIMNR